MSSPFDDEAQPFFVLVNEEGQHSLWPAFAAVPAGWNIVFGQDSHAACLAFVETHWTDMRPKSLVESERQ